MATEEPLSKEGRDLKVKCKSMAFYEVRYRLRTHEKEGPKAALLQFLDADGRPITEEHVCPGFSEEVGRYSYLKANPETGVGVVRFFAPASGGRLTLRFRAWANRYPVLLGRDISVRQIASWTIAAEPGNREPVRLIPVARPLSVPVPAKSKVRLSVALRAEADGASIVLHAPCTMTMEGGRLKLGEASGESGSLRPFAGKGMQAALVVENADQTPVVLSLACEGATAIDLADVVADVAAADDATGEGLSSPAGSPSGLLPTPARSHGEKVRWTTKVGNRLFLHSTIIDTKQELMLTGEKLSRMEHALEESLLLVEKKVDYLLAKIDAYAEVDDKNGAALHNGLAAVRKMAQHLGETAGANQAELRNWQDSVDSRLADIEQGNAHLAGEITAVGKKGHELAETVKAGQEAAGERLKAVQQAERELREVVTAGQETTDERLKAVQQAERELRKVVTAGQEKTDVRLGAIERANADLTRDLAFVRDAGRKFGEAVDANQKELLSRQDGLEGRLAAIEKSGAKLAAILDASDSHIKQALKDIGGRTKKLEEMDKRLAKLAEPKKPEPAPIEPAEKGKPTVLVELLGPSGVGKSTILRAAQALRTPEQWWWGADEIDTVISEAKTDRAKQRDAVDSFLPPDFARRCIDIITSSRMLPSQIIAANNGLRTTSQATDLTRGLSSRHPLVHDELLLHRASSMLLHSERYEDHANWYFDTVPIPSAAVIIRAEAIAIVERVSRRSTQRINTYYNLDDDALLEIVNRSLRLSEIAAERLDRRGVTVAVIDAGGSVTESAQFLHDFVFARSEKGN
ncbi:hypothetical protein [Neoaquamicrobium sediminum]|uniref:hypothetical protein n=1 Tax=Neoaquamicrobium sediminum TaxID=1849104 RepID=UPI003BA8D46A